MHNPDDNPSNCFILLMFSKLFNFHAICRGKCASTNTYGDRAPFWFGGGPRSREERIKAMNTRGFTQLRAARMRKTLLLLCGLYCVLGSAECYSTLRQLIRPSVGGLLPPPLPHVAHGASFYMRKRLPTGGNVGGGKTGKRCVGYSSLHSAIIPNSDGRGQGH